MYVRRQLLSYLNSLDQRSFTLNVSISTAFVSLPSCWWVPAALGDLEDSSLSDTDDDLEKQIHYHWCALVEDNSFYSHE